MMDIVRNQSQEIKSLLGSAIGRLEPALVLNIVSILFTVLAVQLFQQIAFSRFAYLYLIGVYSAWAYCSLYIEKNFLRSRFMSNQFYISGAFIMPAFLIAIAYLTSTIFV